MLKKTICMNSECVKCSQCVHYLGILLEGIERRRMARRAEDLKGMKGVVYEYKSK